MAGLSAAVTPCDGLQFSVHDLSQCPSGVPRPYRVGTHSRILRTISPGVATNLHSQTLNKKSGRTSSNCDKGTGNRERRELEFELKSAHSCTRKLETVVCQQGSETGGCKGFNGEGHGRAQPDTKNRRCALSSGSANCTAVDLRTFAAASRVELTCRKLARSTRQSLTGCCHSFGTLNNLQTTRTLVNRVMPERSHSSVSSAWAAFW